MPILLLQTPIQAPQQICFDLARDAAFHVETSRETGEKIVAGKATGHFELGDEVVFEGRHLGVRQKLGARIVVMESPNFFVDEMTSGAFQSLSHRHEFVAQPDGCTLMIDTLEWRSPFGLLGVVADSLLIKSHLRRFLQRRVLRIKERAEAQTSTV